VATDPGRRQAGFRPPRGSCTILLIRHGESEAAVPGRPFPLVDGHGDPALHPEGRAQAVAVADRLAREPVAAVVVSNLRRTAETAAPLADRLGLRPQVEPELREVYLGDWEGGLFRHRVAEGHPLALRMLEEQRWDAVPNAETNAGLGRRVTAALQRLAGVYPDRLVAVFTHGGVIGAALSHATGSRPFAFVGADNASISQLVIDRERWVLRSYNDTSHLGRRFAPDPAGVI
jgi:probable phosphoglycerate mutase